MSSAADSSAASGDVLVRRANGILIVTINRPDQRNAVKLAEGFQRQRAYLEPVFASQDAAEGVAAFRERRDPVWQDR